MMSILQRRPPAGQQARIGPVLALMCLLLIIALPATADDRRDGSVERARETGPARPDSPDTSVMTGNGLNNLGGPIFRKTAEGTFRKDPGSRVWMKMELVTREQMREQRQQLRLQRLAREGDKPLDIVVEVPDTTERAALRKFGIVLTEAPPCTAKVRILYRQLDSLKQRGTIFWFPGQRRPGSPEPAKSIEQAAPSPPPQSPQPTRQSGGEGINSVTIWSDNFETYAVPGTNWTSYDADPNGGSDNWGRNTTSCGYVFGGTYSVHCAYIGDEPCLQYAPSQLAEMDQVSTLNIAGYPSVAVQVSANYQINDGTYDVFNVWLDTGSGFALFDTRYGSSGGWIPLTYFLSGFSSLRIAFEFVSDGVYQLGYGVYLDNVTVVGTQPNLSYYTPAGWPAPIVPSSVIGTTSVGTLYTGELVYLDWSIVNNGDANASNTFYVDFIGYDTNGSTVLFDNFRSVPGLSQGATWTRTDDVTFTINTAGTHKIRMVVDSLPSSQVAESNETSSDNGITRTYTWVNRANLVIDNVTVTPASPLVGNQIDVAVTIRNTGTENITSTFYTDLYQNPAIPPAPPNPGPGDATVATFGLNGGASTTLHFFRSSPVATTWQMYLYVDRTNVVQESPTPGACPNECNNRYGPVTVVWSSGSLAVSGRFMYDDSLGGANQPMKCVTVKLYDQNPPSGPDHLLAQTFTNDQGYFGPVNLTNQDPDDGGLLDLYARAEFSTSTSCRGSQAVVVRDANYNIWSAQTGVSTNVPNGTFDFGTQKPTDSPRKRALHVYHTLLRGYDYVVGKGITPSTLSAQWFPGNPRHTSYIPDSAKVTINSKIGQATDGAYVGPDDYDDFPILHEYGHHITYITAALTLWGSCPGLDAPHLGCALSEGWADWFASQTVLGSPTSIVYDWNQNTAAAGDTSRLIRNLETGVITFRDGSTFNGNASDEHYIPGVFSTLWDLSDAANDNQPPASCGEELADPVSRTWQTTFYHPNDPMNDFCDFRNLYYKTFILGDATATTHFQNTMCEHGILCGGQVAVEPAAGDNLSFGVPSPNPFTREMALRFHIPSTLGGSRVRVDVFNVAGARVATLFDGTPGGGELTLRWDGRMASGDRCSAGVYFLRMQCGPHEAKRSLVRLQ